VLSATITPTAPASWAFFTLMVKAQDPVHQRDAARYQGGVVTRQRVAGQARLAIGLVDHPTDGAFMRWPASVETAAPTW
jgi:hypothetical protein